MKERDSTGSWPTPERRTLPEATRPLLLPQAPSMLLSLLRQMLPLPDGLRATRLLLRLPQEWWMLP